jgi:hypothetical protein
VKAGHRDHPVTQHKINANLAARWQLESHVGGKRREMKDRELRPTGPQSVKAVESIGPDL